MKLSILDSLLKRRSLINRKFYQNRKHFHTLQKNILSLKF
jgi:hypothetical protein